VAHYFSPDPVPDQARRRRTIEFRAASRQFRLVSDSGVFSATRLDPGTGVLLRKAALPSPDQPGPLLDLGCGYGAIACVLATVAPAAQVWAVDVNPRARELAAENARALGIAPRVRVAAPDDVPEALEFAQIWSNPPVRIGKAALHALLERWLPRLTRDGVAWLVIAHYLGGDSLQRWLAEQGWPVIRHASSQGYRVLRVTAPAA
jgi:16S rRNA (guanine1207-N2)-methyltransferase